MIRQKSQKGFTLIELIVSIAIFTIVMLIAIGAVLNAVDANRKAQNINVIVNNLNLAIESMARDLRTGSNYRSCGSQSGVSYNCVQFRDKDGNPNVKYFMTTSSKTGTSMLSKSGSPNGSGVVTGDEITLSDVSFIFNGLGTGDGPERILVHLKGSAGAGKTKAEFNIETVITSRILESNEFN